MLNTLPSNFASAVTPYTPLGRAPVSEENVEQKASSFKPLEEGAEAARNQNRRSPEDQPNETQEQERTRADAQAKAAEAQQLKERQQEVTELAKRDREVRAHERAHAAAGGQFAGAPTYETTRGPDGVSYAVAGEVNIDTSKVAGDPQATLAKALQVHAAATAPAEPSAQDRQVAAEASRMAADARAELAQLVREDLAQDTESVKERAQNQKDDKPVPVGGAENSAGVAAGLQPASSSSLLYSLTSQSAGPYTPVDLRA
jgi:hypothetical protein